MKRIRILSDLGDLKIIRKIKMEGDFNPWKVKSLEDFTRIVYSCPECEQSFSTSEQFVGHAMMSHPKARATLPDILNVQGNVPEEKSGITEYLLANQDFVEVNQDSVEEECMEAYQCDLCPVFFYSEGDLTKHKSDGHRCEFCSSTFHSVKGKSKHMRNNHNYQCHKCNQTFTLKKDLKNHDCQEWPDLDVESFDQSQPKFNCNFCDKSFRTKEKRDRHVNASKNHHNCRECREIFRTKKDLKNHEDSMAHSLAHPSSVTQPMFNCSICGKYFSTKKGRDRHMKNDSKNCKQLKAHKKFQTLKVTY